jgi:tocopherol O-methyltransferase
MIRPNRPRTTAAVAAHYDELDPFYREVWGEHVHHGLWATGREGRTAAAAEPLVDLVAARLDLAPGQSVCDIGCGYGATAARLAERHGVHVTGVTVSSLNNSPGRQRDRAAAIGRASTVAPGGASIGAGRLRGWAPSGHAAPRLRAVARPGWRGA